MGFLTWFGREENKNPSDLLEHIQDFYEIHPAVIQGNSTL